MLIEYSVEHPAGRGYFYAELELPATQAQIRDAQQKARLIGREDSAYCEIEGPVKYFSQKCIERTHIPLSFPPRIRGGRKFCAGQAVKHSASSKYFMQR